MRFVKTLGNYKYYLYFLVFSILSIFFIEFSYYYFSWPDTLNWITGNLYLFSISCLIIMSFMVFIFSICRHSGISIFIPFAISICYGIANYFKLTYRSFPVLPYEIPMIFDLKQLLGFIGEDERMYIIWALICLFIIFIVLLIFCKRTDLSKNTRLINGIISGYIILMIYNYNSTSQGFYKLLNIIFIIAIFIFIVTWDNKLKFKIIPCILVLVLLFPNFNSNSVKRKIDLKAEYPLGHFAYDNFDIDGVVPAFLSYTKVDIIEKPKNYSKKSINEIVNKYSELANTNNTSRIDIATIEPNIIYVMNESFSDPKNVNNPKLNKNPLINYDDLKTKHSNGTTIAQGFGGGTNVSEFEALTGVSGSFVNNTMFFSNIDNRHSFPSIASFLKGKGYSTAALHFNTPFLYGRSEGYSNIGLDHFYSKDDNLEIEYYDNNIYYASDESDYKQTIKILKEYKNPTFIHNVTIQNHGPYSFEISNNDFDITGLSNPEKVAEAKTYYKELEHSDEVFAEFLNELDQFPEPTIVVFWGDHLPYFYEDADFGQDIMDKYETPFMIYSNFHDQRATELNEISMQYLPNEIFNLFNFKKSPYYYLLDDLKSVSNITHFQYNTEFPENEFAKYKNGLEISANSQQIYDDYKMILYDILKGKNYSVDLGFYN